MLPLQPLEIKEENDIIKIIPAGTIKAHHQESQWYITHLLANQDILRIPLVKTMYFQLRIWSVKW